MARAISSSAARSTGSRSRSWTRLPRRRSPRSPRSSGCWSLRTTPSTTSGVGPGWRCGGCDAVAGGEISSIPEEQRVLVTAHDAFNYFGRRYGMEVRGLQGISTEAEAGSGDVQELADFLAENEIKAIFIESSVPPQTIEAVQDAARNRGWELEIGGELYSDAGGDEGTEAETYTGMFREK